MDADVQVGTVVVHMANRLGPLFSAEWLIEL